MAQDHPKWKITEDRSVQLSAADQIYLCPKNLKKLLENTRQHPGIHPWVGDIDHWKKILETRDDPSKFSARSRRLGRLLFAANLEKFSRVFQQKNNEIQIATQGKATIHVCAGLSGGTGSGIIIDVVSQIRALIPGEFKANIFLYLFAPNEHPRLVPGDSQDAANIYASLVEINSFAIGRFQPHSLMGQGERMSQEKTAFSPFTAAYLFSDTCENGYVISAEPTIPANVLAEFLFHKNLTYEFNENIKSSSLLRAETWQFLDRSVNSEIGLAREAPKRDGFDLLEPEMERSRRFLTFGVMAITPDLISEYSSAKAYEEIFNEKPPVIQRAGGSAQNIQDGSRNILLEIMERIGPDASKQKEKFTQFLVNSSVFLSRDPSEMAKVGPFPGMTTDSKNWIQFFVAVFSKTNTPAQEKVTHLLESLDAQVLCSGLPEGPCRMGITLIQIAARFPLRTVSFLKNYRQRYKSLMDSGVSSARYLHSEDLKTMDLPSLYLPTTRDVENLAIPHVLIGLALDVVCKETSGINAQKLDRQMAARTHTDIDSKGFEMSGDIFGFVEWLSPENLMTLRREVQKTLARGQNQRQDLIEKLNHIFEREHVFVHRKFGEESEQSQRLHRAFERTMEILSKYDPPPKRPGEGAGLAAI